MAVMAELHWATYYEPRPDSEYMKRREQEYLETEKRHEAHFWEVECQAWPIDMKEKQDIVKAKCEKVAPRLREIAELKKRAAEDAVIAHNQPRIRRRLERLLKDFPREEVLQELKIMEIC